jgi:hypothetical protein
VSLPAPGAAESHVSVSASRSISREEASEGTAGVIFYTRSPRPHATVTTLGNEEVAKTHGLKASLLALALLSVVLYLAAMTIFRMSNNDIWIHLKTGEYVLTNGSVPEKDPYSFIAADRDYIAHEWLAGVIFHLVHASGGVNGLILFKTLVITAACFLLYGAARLLGSRLSVILPAFALVLYIASARFLVRPHVFSYFMGALYLWLFFRYRECGRRRAWLYLIPVAHVLWTNLHGGYIQGLLMIATFALGESLIWMRARYLRSGEDKVLPGRDVALLWILLPSCLLASLVNPYGYRLLLFPFQLTGMQLFMQNIYEWMPSYHSSYNRSTMQLLYLILIGWLGVTFFLVNRDRSRSQRGGERLIAPNVALIAAIGLAILAILFFLYLLPPETEMEQQAEIARTRILMYAIVAIVALHAMVNARSVDFTLAGVFLLFYGLSLRHNRAVTDAAMATLPILAAATTSLLRAPPRLGAADAAAEPGDVGRRAAPVPEGPTSPDRSSPLSVVLGSLLLLGLAFHVIEYDYYYDFRGSGRATGLGVAENMPVCAVDFIERNRITGHAFVSYADAALLIHRMHPAVKVNMDSRNDVYGEDLYREYLAALRSPETMEAYLDRHRIDFFLLSYRDRIPDVFDRLEASGAWAPVYYDTRDFVLARRTAENEELIHREAFRIIRPTPIGETIITTENGFEVLREAERAIRNCPTSTIGYFYKSRALQALGRLEDALAVNRKILAFDPRYYRAYAEMAYIYVLMDRPGKAIEMYEEALRIDPGYSLARENLQRLRSSGVVE